MSERYSWSKNCSLTNDQITASFRIKFDGIEVEGLDHLHEPSTPQDGMIHPNVLQMLPHRTDVDRSWFCRIASHEHEALDALLLKGIINEGVHGRSWIRDFGGDEVDGGYLLSVGELVLEWAPERAIVCVVELCRGHVWLGDCFAGG